MIANVDLTAMSDMRSLVEKVNEMRAQRSMLVLQLRETVNTDDITSQLLTRTGESLDEIFKHEIEKHNKSVTFNISVFYKIKSDLFTIFCIVQVNLINQNMTAQENILKALTEAYAKYAPTKKLISDVLKKKESFLTGTIFIIIIHIQTFNIHCVPTSSSTQHPLKFLASLNIIHKYACI